MAMSVSGHCAFCSRGDRLVLHGATRCPRQPVMVVVDYNMARGSRIVGRSSHPLVLGEYALLFDADWLACWGRVVELRGSGYRFEIVSDLIDPPTNPYEVACG